MQNKLKTTVLLVLLANFGFAQQITPTTKLPEKVTVQENSHTDKTVATTVQNDSPNAKSFDVAEGKKGLNAVNVRNAKQAGSVNETGRTVRPNGQDDGNPFPPKNGTTSLQKPKEKSNGK